MLITFEYSGDHCALEEIGVVFQGANQPLPRLLNPQCQIKRSPAGIDCRETHAWIAGWLRVTRGLMQRKADLDQRRIRWVCEWNQLLDEFEKRRLLMRERSERHLAHAAQQFCKTRIAFEISTHHESVDEASDQTFGLDFTPRHTRRDADIFSSGQRRKQNVQYCQHCHE